MSLFQPLLYFIFERFIQLLKAFAKILFTFLGGCTLISLLFLTGFTSTHQNQSVSAEEQERFENAIVEKYVKKYI